MVFKQVLVRRLLICITAVVLRRRRKVEQSQYFIFRIGCVRLFRLDLMSGAVVHCGISVDRPSFLTDVPSDPLLGQAI